MQPRRFAVLQLDVSHRVNLLAQAAAITIAARGKLGVQLLNFIIQYYSSSRFEFSKSVISATSLREQYDFVKINILKVMLSRCIV